MTKEERIEGFVELGNLITDLDVKIKTELFSRAASQNPWYTVENIERSLGGIRHMLRNESIRKWINNYELPTNQRTVGIIMAGNIPLVGFHDMLAVLSAGHKAVIKLSNQDEVLPKAIVELLAIANTGFNALIEFCEILPKVDAVIATGSDNSSRYFKKYFSHLPHIIRQNRTSVAILDGSESAEDQRQLGEDIFSYFGMGCRNVSKLFIPQGYEIEKLLPAFQKKGELINHPKFFNNYEYNKAIYLVNGIKHLDNGFALFTKSTELVSPLSVVYYEEYTDKVELQQKLDLINEKLQCLVSNTDLNQPTVPFGKAQLPEIDDYADNVDTMAFLCSN